MSVIKKYLEELDKLLNEVPFKFLTNIQTENRGDVALYIHGKIMFIDRSELHFKEYFVAIPILKRVAYSYHYQNDSKELVFRYDNADHHPEVETYPCHKHVRKFVLPSHDVSFQEVIKEIIMAFTK